MSHLPQLSGMSTKPFVQPPGVIHARDMYPEELIAAARANAATGNAAVEPERRVHPPGVIHARDMYPEELIAAARANAAAGGNTRPRQQWKAYAAAALALAAIIALVVGLVIPGNGRIAKSTGPSENVTQTPREDQADGAVLAFGRCEHPPQAVDLSGGGWKDNSPFQFEFGVRRPESRHQSALLYRIDNGDIVEVAQAGRNGERIAGIASGQLGTKLGKEIFFLVLTDGADGERFVRDKLAANLPGSVYADLQESMSREELRKKLKKLFGGSLQEGGNWQGTPDDIELVDIIDHE